MSKLRISRKIELDYGHTLPNHIGFCNQLHGHRAIVIATVLGEVQTEEGSSQGMVLDFKFLKKKLMEKVHDKLDHAFAVWKDDEETLPFIKKRNKRYLITDEPPTAEYLVKWSFEQLVNEMPEGVELIKMKWYETPNAYATYKLEDYKNDQIRPVSTY
jgi:6-pyruvoyltetrahydropterin/6-carboxytetrahydropterin synthase